jgi:hypothetical protein
MEPTDAEARVAGSVDRAERLQIMLDADELAAVDDFRFQNRMPSRAAAVRELMKRGLSAVGFSAANAGTKSSSFGVLDVTSAERRGRHGSGRSED